MHGVVSVRNTTWAAAGLLWVAAATAQTAPPSGLTAEVKDAKAGNAPSEAARRQAESPYRFILLNANKPKPARKEAPARPAAPAAKPVAGNAQVLPEAAAAARAQLTQAGERKAAPAAAAASAASAGSDTAAPGASPAATPSPAATAGAAGAAGAEPTAQPAAATGAETPAGPAAAQAAPTAAATNGAPGDLLATSPAPTTPPVKTLDIEPPAPPPEDEPVVLVPLKRDPPVIPPAVQREARKGSVKVHFTVMPDGSVHDAKAVSTTEFAFNRPVLAAVSKWRFEPIRSEQQVEVQIDIDLDAGR